MIPPRFLPRLPRADVDLPKDAKTYPLNLHQPHLMAATASFAIFWVSASSDSLLLENPLSPRGKGKCAKCRGQRTTREALCGASPSTVLVSCARDDRLAIPAAAVSSSHIYMQRTERVDLDKQNQRGAAEWSTYSSMRIRKCCAKAL